MSETGVSLPYRQAAHVAAMIVQHLERYCVRIEVAGSIRRHAEVCHDVELVVIPATTAQGTLFDDAAPPPPPKRGKAKEQGPADDLDNELHWMLTHGDVRKRQDARGRTFWGPRDKRMLWKMAAGPVGNLGAGEVWIPVDVFGALPSTWGAKLALRTGPYQLSRRLVTPIGKGGLLPPELEFREGGLYCYPDKERPLLRRFIPTPEEADVFFALGLPCIPPPERHPSSFAGVHRRGQ